MFEPPSINRHTKRSLICLFFFRNVIDTLKISIYISHKLIFLSKYKKFGIQKEIFGVPITIFFYFNYFIFFPHKSNDPELASEARVDQSTDQIDGELRFHRISKILLLKKAAFVISGGGRATRYPALKVKSPPRPPINSTVSLLSISLQKSSRYVKPHL